jgi:DNA-binding transcriptional MerR regulator
MRWFFDTSYVVSASVRIAIRKRFRELATQAVSEKSCRSRKWRKTFGVTMRTLRFYESKGLLQPRRIGNRRFYDEACRARLRLVLKGKAMGLGLDEIGELVERS